MISRTRVKKTASEWLALKVLPEDPEIYRFVMGKDRFDPLIDRIHAMINRVISRPITFGPDKAVVFEFKSQDAIDAYIIKCLMTYCVLWKKQFNESGPATARSAEPSNVRPEVDTLAMGDDEGDADGVRLEPGST